MDLVAFSLVANNQRYVYLYSDLCFSVATFAQFVFLMSVQLADEHFSVRIAVFLHGGLGGEVAPVGFE